MLKVGFVPTDRHFRVTGNSAKCCIGERALVPTGWDEGADPHRGLGDRGALRLEGLEGFVVS